MDDPLFGLLLFGGCATAILIAACIGGSVEEIEAETKGPEEPEKP